MANSIILDSKKDKEFTELQAQLYTNKRGKNTRFYIQVWGWSITYKFIRTVATPSGKYKSTKTFYPDNKMTQ